MLLAEVCRGGEEGSCPRWVGQEMLEHWVVMSRFVGNVIYHLRRIAHCERPRPVTCSSQLGVAVE
jgi:hypothetical protein